MARDSIPLTALMCMAPRKREDDEKWEGKMRNRNSRLHVFASLAALLLAACTTADAIDRVYAPEAVPAEAQTARARMRLPGAYGARPAQNVTGRVAAARRGPGGAVEEVLVSVDGGRHVRVRNPELRERLVHELGSTVTLRGSIVAASEQSIVMDVDEYEIIAGRDQGDAERPSYYY